MDDERCTATSKNSGQRCKRYPIPGGTVCVMHGGKAGQVKAKALERLQEAKAAKFLERFDIEPMTDPIDAALTAAGEAKALHDYFREEVTKVADDPTLITKAQGENLRAVLLAYERSLERTFKMAVEIEKLGLETRRVRLQETQVIALGQALAKAIERAGLTGEQRENLKQAWADELRRLG